MDKEKFRDQALAMLAEIEKDKDMSEKDVNPMLDDIRKAGFKYRIHPSGALEVNVLFDHIMYIRKCRITDDVVTQIQDVAIQIRRLMQKYESVFRTTFICLLLWRMTI